MINPKEFAMKGISKSGHLMGKRFGLGRDAIFQLWKAPIKDDERLLDEAIAETYERMVRVDPARAELAVQLSEQCGLWHNGVASGW
jgi:hypothetical protein